MKTQLKKKTKIFKSPTPFAFTYTADKKQITLYDGLGIGRERSSELAAAMQKLVNDPTKETTDTAYILSEASKLVHTPQELVFVGYVLGANLEQPSLSDLIAEHLTK